MYGITLLVSSVATFGALGILFGILILAAWAYVFASRSRPTALLWASVVSIICFCLLGSSIQGTLRSECRNNLKRIAIALHNYHDTYGLFPPAYIADKNGRPMHSWRVLILPYLDQALLFNTYDFDELWNGPNNRELLSNMPAAYACPAEVHNRNGRGKYTSYVAVVGPRTSWPDSLGRKINEFKDGTSNTILVLEWNSGGIPWMEPRDLSFEDALRLLASSEPESAGGHRHKDFFYEYYPGRSVAFADTSVRFLPHEDDREVWSALLTVDDGGARFDWDVIGWDSVTRKKLRLGNCCRFAIFVLLVLIPLPWVWLNPTSGRDSPVESLSK